MTTTAVGISDLCVQQVLGLVTETGLFKKNTYSVYDPAILFDRLKSVNYPACGVMYGGLTSDQGDHDQGISSSLLVGVYVVTESKIRDTKQQADKKSIAVLLDTTRAAVLFDDGDARLSPTGKTWRVVRENVLEVKDRGLVYLQIFKTPYTGSAGGPQYYSGNGEVLISAIRADGSLEGYQPIGTVSRTDVRRVVEQKTHRDSEHAGKKIDKIINFKEQVFLDFEISALTDFGVEFVQAGAVTTLPATDTTAEFKVSLGKRYSIPQLNTTAQIFKNLSVATLKENTNYIWTNKPCGTFEILSDQSGAATPLTEGEQVLVTYTAPEQQELVPFTNNDEIYACRIEGLNNVDGEPVVLEARKTVRNLSGTNVIHSKNIGLTNLSLSLVDQFYMERKI
jgi:hypothetical protein